jgi:putative membrane protein
LSAAPLGAQSGSAQQPRIDATQAGRIGTRSGGATDQSGSRAGSQSGTPGGQSTPSASPDSRFVMDAALGGMAEVELGKLASDKASNAQVKQFAQRMVDDHGRANDELKSIAQQKSIALPADLDVKHKATRDRLAKLSGTSFDRAYMQEMLTDHRKDVMDFRKESESGKDPEVKAFAARTLPTLEDHLKMAQSTNGAVGTSGTTSDDSGPKGATGNRGTSGSGASGSSPGGAAGSNNPR